VPLRYHLYWLRPRYRERRIVPAEPSRSRRLVEFRHLIEDLCVVFKRQEAVREAFRYVEHPRRLAWLGSQFDRRPLPKSCRIDTQIDNHVVQRAPTTAYEFRFAVNPLLKVHASKGPPLAVVRQVSLDDSGVQPMCLKLAPAIAAREKPTVVFVRVQVDLDDPFQIRF